MGSVILGLTDSMLKRGEIIPSDSPHKKVRDT